MFYANFLWTCGLTMTILSTYTYGTFMTYVGIFVMLLGGLLGVKLDYKGSTRESLQDARFEALKHLVDEQLKQIELLKQEIEILKHR